MNKKPKILLVDDNPLNLHVMGSSFQNDKYDLVVAMNGEIALKTVLEKEIDLILLDITMPGIDGYEVCRRLKSNSSTEEIPVIFITARIQSEDVIKGFEVGAVDYVTKPFNAKELLQRVDTHLKIKRQNVLILEQNQKLTEQKQLLENQNHELKELNATKDKFFSIIAHDLKNPIGSFKLMTEVLSKEYEDFDDKNKIFFINNLKDSSTNLYNLLENLLTWSGSQRGVIECHPELTDLNMLISLTLGHLSAQSGAKNIELINKVSENTMALIDANLSSTIIRNLISNSIKYSNDNSNIEVLSYQENDSIVVDIKDYGVGMDEKTKDSIFRIDKSKSEPGTKGEQGTGLGLIVCKEFVEKQGGRIWVESILGEGSSFKFTIPKS